MAAVAGASAQAKKEEGASLVEYALLVALIAVVCIVAITTLGNQVSTKFSEISSGVSSN
ncbi:Flp family type IVb pilin [bacterium]|nr:Flp family type IVb pilin [bacterium]